MTLDLILGVSSLSALALAAWRDSLLRRARVDRDIARTQAAAWEAIADGRRALRRVERDGTR